MKGKEIFTEIIRDEVPDTEQVREKILREAVIRTIFKKPLLTRLMIASVASAAVVFLIILGGIQLFSPESGSIPNDPNSMQSPNDPNVSSDPNRQHSGDQISLSENMFTLQAFIPELQSIESSSQIDANGDPSGWIEINDRFEYDQDTYELGQMDWLGSEKVLYKYLIVRYEGENIESVEFSADNDGFFMKGSAPTKNGIPLHIIRGEELILPQYAREMLGNSFTVYNIEEITENAMLYVGRDISDSYPSLELNVTIRVTATFANGTKQEVTFLVK